MKKVAQTTARRRQLQNAEQPVCITNIARTAKHRDAQTELNGYLMV